MQNKITSNGPENVVLRNAKWGTWFALGSRKLVNTDDLNSITQFDVIPNPFGEDIYLKLNSNFSQSANLKDYESYWQCGLESKFELI
ncbi:MAG: hypothetical protein IPO62_16975 [Saprospiraceae bacterium]|nr:hypothetical protein [Saprospiraceae bacterium]